jgi:hypothetical protein
MKVLITGADGFIGSNLRVSLGRAQGRGGGVLHARQHRRAELPQRSTGADSSSIWPGSTGHGIRASSHRQRGPSPRAGARRWPAGKRSQDRRWRSARPPRRPATIPTAPASARRGAPAARIRGAHRRTAHRLPPDQCVRQVGKAQLQLGGGDVLPQHRARAADPRSTIRRRRCAWSTSMTWSKPLSGC